MLTCVGLSLGTILVTGRHSRLGLSSHSSLGLSTSRDRGSCPHSTPPWAYRELSVRTKFHNREEGPYYLEGFLFVENAYTAFATIIADNGLVLAKILKTPKIFADKRPKFTSTYHESTSE